MSQDKKVLTPIEQQVVQFYDDELTAVRADDGRVYASLRHMCQALDIDPTGQRQRIQRHSVLNNGLMVCKIQTIQGERDTYVLRASLVPLWLTGIRTSMVAEETRPKLERFQQEAADVLWEAFQEGRLTADPSLDALLQGATPAAQAYRMAQAIMQMARQQLMLEERVDDHEDRLGTLESQLMSEQKTISEAQASQISQAVKAVAMALSAKSGRNEYGGVYGELYRRFEITSYKLLPVSRFQEAMDWLTEWHQALTGETPF